MNHKEFVILDKFNPFFTAIKMPKSLNIYRNQYLKKSFEINPVLEYKDACI